MSLDNILLKIQNNFSIVYVLLGGFLLFLIWASTFDIDKSIRSQGVVVANSNNQIIQVTDGGVLAKLLIANGQKVSKGQLLASLEKQRIQSNYNQIHSDIAYFQSSLNRIDAQIFNKKIVFDDFITKYPNFIESQKLLYLQQKKTIKQKIDLLNQNLKLNITRLEMSKKLFKTGDISKLEVLEIEEKILEINGKITDINNEYQNKLKSEKEKVIAELSKNHYKLKQQNDILKHSNIYSPVTGVVKQLKVTTIGGVLKAGEVLMEISPLNGGVVLKTKIKPSDIADIKIDMPALIKLDAFDYTIFGGLEGKVNYISSDTLLEKDSSGKEQNFYQVNIFITSKNNKIKPKLGMSATVEIKTGRRSLFNYLTKPIIRGFSGALSEK